MADDAYIYVEHILTEIEVLNKIAEMADFKKFESDPILFRASAYCIQCISEAVRNLPAKCIADYPEIRWREIRGIGNHTRHEYSHLKAFLFWGIIMNDLGSLQSVMLKLKDEFSR